MAYPSKGYYSASKGRKLWTQATTRRNHGDIMLSDIKSVTKEQMLLRVHPEVPRALTFRESSMVVAWGCGRREVSVINEYDFT